MKYSDINYLINFFGLKTFTITIKEIHSGGLIYYLHKNKFELKKNKNPNNSNNISL